MLIQQHHYQAVPAKITAAGQPRPLQQIPNTANSQTGGSSNNNNEQEDYGCESAEQYDRVSTHSILSKSASTHSFVMGDEKVDCKSCHECGASHIIEK